MELEWTMTCKNAVMVNGALRRCRKCLPCQITYRQSWGLRIMHESTRYLSSSFVTFTYNDDYLPSNGSLVKDHMQKFWRDLRYDLRSSSLRFALPDGKLRYYMAGEYGDTMRPHYHAIIFGLNPQTRETREIIMDNWPRADWLSLPLDRTFGSVTRQSAEYVAGYVHKKYNGSLQRKMYQDNGLIPPYSTKSLGIGKEYAVRHARQILELGYCLSDTGKKLPVPDYYIDLLVKNPRKCNIDDDLLNKFYFDIIERNMPTLLDQLYAPIIGARKHAESFTLARRGVGQHS